MNLYVYIQWIECKIPVHLILFFIFLSHDSWSTETSEITDFCCFYTLPSSILGSQNYSTLKVAYSYYNVSTKTSLTQLMKDALIVAKQKDIDVFNALDVIQNETFLKELKSGLSDWKLHYFPNNYRMRRVKTIRTRACTLII
jgi:glycylpeptide N-tetradecanoyltransferase